MATVKRFIIAHTLLFYASILCMEQGQELALTQKVASIKEKQKTYFAKCDTVGVHAGGEPALLSIAGVCAYLAVRDIHSAYTFPETAPYKIPAAILNAFGSYVMHQTTETITTKKTNAEKDITTLLADLDTLLALDVAIKPQQAALGRLHTQAATHRTTSKAYLTASVLGLMNLINTGYSAYALHPLFEKNGDLSGNLAREFLLQNFLTLAAVCYSKYERTREKNVLEAQKIESGKLTTLMDNLIKSPATNNNNNNNNNE